MDVMIVVKILVVVVIDVVDVVLGFWVGFFMFIFVVIFFLGFVNGIIICGVCYLVMNCFIWLDFDYYFVLMVYFDDKLLL